MNNVEKVFEELKKKRIINRERTLIEKKNVLNFKSSVIFKNKIFYNPKFSNQAENELRFILLHEEGHKQRFQLSWIAIGIPFFFAAMTIGFMKYFFIFFAIVLKTVLGLDLINKTSYSLFSFFLPLIIFATIYKFTLKLIKYDEFYADSFAAKLLKDKYGIKKPSELVKKALCRPMIGNLSIFGKVILFFYKFFPYHPTIQERINKVKQIE